MLKLMVHFSLRQRVIVLIAALALCVYGYVAARGLPIDVLPDINKPTVSILTEVPGLAPEEVEAQVTAPIEMGINGAAGVERVRSVSGIGLSVVHVEFAWGSDIYRCRQTVQERLAEARERLPENVTPHMGPISSLMGEIMLMGVTSSTLTPMEQREAADWLVRPALLAIPGVSNVTVIGGELKQFQVKADPDKLRLFGVTLEDLERAVAASNKNTGGGFLIGSSNELVVRNIGRLRTSEEIASALVATRLSEPGNHAVAVRVRDVARVVEGPAAARRGDASVLAQPGVILAISKQPGADTRAVTDAIDKRLKELGPSLPKGLVVDPDLFRQAHFIEASVGNVIEALRDGTILVVIVLILFLLNWRVTVITLTAIPLSILTTFIVFKLLGESVNTMTLGGIAIAVGELVDDAVVGVENIHRRLRENRASAKPGPALRVIFDATCEVRGPILVSTAIVLLVFLPLFFLPGLAGRLFTPLAHAYIVSVFASMIVSLTVTPVLSWYLLGKGRKGLGPASGEEKDGLVLRTCKAAAKWAYDRTLDRPMAVLGVCGALVILCSVAVVRMGSEFLPAFNEGTAVVGVNVAPGVSLAESARLGTTAERILLEIPEVKHVARRTGRAENDEHALGPNSSEIEVDFFDDEDVGAQKKGKFAVGPGDRVPPSSLRTRREVFRDIRERLGELPGANVTVGQPIGHRIEHLETGVQAQIVVKIQGQELSQLRAVAEKARSLMSGLAGVVDLEIEQQVMTPQVRVKIDAERAAVYGFTPAQLVDTLETAVGGRVVSQVLDGLKSYDLVVMFDDPWRADLVGGSTVLALKRLTEVRLVSPSGAVALIGDVADVQEYFAPNQVSRENAQRRIVVSCNVQGQDLGRTAESIERTLAERLTPPVGYAWVVEGQFESQRKAVRVIAILGALSLLVMLTLLWTHFGSGIMAAQVMLNIPFAFIGAVAALLIAREPFSVASLIGFISLCGISARNGVLMISHYLHLMLEEKMPFGREMVIKGSQERVAPVLMTALTTGLATLPLILSPDAPGKEILYPLALVVFGGLITSTLLDFFVTPTVFLRFSKRASQQLLDRRTRHDHDDVLEDVLGGAAGPGRAVQGGGG